MPEAGTATPPALAVSTAAEATSVAPACTNCGSAAVASYCADCGERQPSRHDFSVRALVTDAMQEITSLDGRLVRSVRALVTRPGHLTREWFEGRRGRYVKPFSLFVLLNVAFFLIQPHTHLLSYGYQQYASGSTASAAKRRVLLERRRAERHETPAAFAARFDQELQGQKKALMVFYVPAMAVVMGLLYAWRKRFFAEHLVFSIHAWAFVLLFLGVAVPVLFKLIVPGLIGLGAPPRVFAALDGDQGITTLLFLTVGTYLYKALRRVYDDRPVPAALRAFVLFYLIGALTNVYHDVLFYTTLYSL